jgi:hypothetical protein
MSLQMLQSLCFREGETGKIFLILKQKLSISGKKARDDLLYKVKIYPFCMICHCAGILPSLYDEDVFMGRRRGPIHCDHASGYQTFGYQH